MYDKKLGGLPSCVCQLWLRYSIQLGSSTCDDSLSLIFLTFSVVLVLDVSSFSSFVDISIFSWSVDVASAVLSLSFARSAMFSLSFVSSDFSGSFSSSDSINVENVLCYEIAAISCYIFSFYSSRFIQMYSSNIIHNNNLSFIIATSLNCR